MPQTSSLSIHQLMDIWILSIVWLLLIMLLFSLGCMCPFKSEFLYPLGRSLVMQLLGNRVALFLIFRGNLHTVFQRGCISLHCHQQYKSAPLSPHSYQLLLFPEFSILAILIGVRWYPTVVLICIYLMSDVEHLFMCLLAIWRPSLEKCLFISSAHFFTGFLLFGC